MSDGSRGFRRVFRLPFTTSRLERALDDELQFHIAERIEEFQARGMSREHAEAEVRRRFGDLEAYRREASSIDATSIRQDSRLELVDSVGRETRHAVRTLARSPSFSAIACLTLALGLGAATTIFTLLDRVVLRPLPYANAERLLHVGTLWPMVRPDAEFDLSRAQFFYFKQHSRVLVDLGLYDTDMMPVSGDGSHPTERVPALQVSASLFSVLGIVPQLGRLFTAEEGVPRHRTVALISNGYWARRYGSDPAVLGKHIVLGPDQSYEIIGVLPPGASVPDFKADIWTPNWLDPAAEPQNNHTHSVIGVVRDGVTLDAVDRDLKRLQKQIEAMWPGVYSKGFIESGFAIHVQWLQHQIVGDKVMRALWILFGAVAVVLLIAAANVANLFLVRSDTRRREVAVRTALGAGRRHLAVHFLMESGLLALAAAVGALAVSYVLLQLVVSLAPQSLPRLEEISLDWRGMLFCVVLALGSGLVFGLLPLMTGAASLAPLREGGRGMTTSRARNTARRALVVSQVALAVVLFSAATLMVKSYARLRDVRPGFDATGVTAMNVALPYARYQRFDQTSAFWRQFLDRIRALPGVEGAGATESLPLVGQSGCSAVVTDGARNTAQRAGCVPTIPVTPGFFEAMGTRVRGSAPTWTDTDGGVGPVVISAAFADQYFPDEDPIGHGIKINNDQFPYFRIVGVAEDVRANGLHKPAVNATYFPLVPAKGTPGWDAGHYMSLVVRAPSIDAARLFQNVRAIARELDPQVPIDEPKAMEAVVARSMAQTSFTMMLLLISAAIALALSAVGLYGVLSYLVSQRRSEIGIRMALGARQTEVTTMVLAQALGLALIGVGLGAVGSIVGTRALQALLFGVSPNDPAVIAGTCVALLLVAVTASLIPARRAAGVDPAEALRSP